MIFHTVWSLENLESHSFLLAWLSYTQIVHEKILHRWFMPCIYRYVLPISPTARMKSCVLFLRGDQIDVYRKYFSFTLQFSNVEVFCFDLSYLIVWSAFEIQIHKSNASCALKWNLNSFIVLSKLHDQLSDENIYLIHVSEDPFCSIYFYLPYTSFAHLGSYPHESKTDNLFIISILLLINAVDTNDVTIRKRDEMLLQLLPL